MFLFFLGAPARWNGKTYEHVTSNKPCAIHICICPWYCYMVLLCTSPRVTWGCVRMWVRFPRPLPCKFLSKQHNCIPPPCSLLCKHNNAYQPPLQCAYCIWYCNNSISRDSVFFWSSMSLIPLRTKNKHYNTATYKRYTLNI